MKTNFTRCAEQEYYKGKPTEASDSVNRIGNIFSTKAANAVFTACHSVPQLNQSKSSDYIGGSESYVVRASRAFHNKVSQRSARADDMMLFMMSMSYMQSPMDIWTAPAFQ